MAIKITITVTFQLVYEQILDNTWYIFQSIWLRKASNS